MASHSVISLSLKVPKDRVTKGTSRLMTLRLPVEIAHCLATVHLKMVCALGVTLCSWVISLTGQRVAEAPWAASLDQVQITLLAQRMVSLYSSFPSSLFPFYFILFLISLSNLQITSTNTQRYCTVQNRFFKTSFGRLATARHDNFWINYCSFGWRNLIDRLFF